MIFVTVGTTKFPFDRLLRAVDEALLKLESKEKLVVQNGRSKYHFHYSRIRIFEDLPFEKMVDFFKEARVVVTHSGPATIFLTLKYGKKMPVVIPRCKNLHEHVNDHQLYYSREISRKKLVKVIYPQDDVVVRLVNYFSNPQSKVNKPTGKLEILTKRLINYTEKQIT